jgi:hypothetical protein
MWSDLWILLNHEMVFDEKVQRAARECLIPVLDEEPDVSPLPNHEATIDRAAFIELLNKAGVVVPDNARVYIQVPGRGDYSNCRSISTNAPSTLITQL